jgi:hypothetical protein
LRFPNQNSVIISYFRHSFLHLIFFFYFVSPII